VSERVERLDWRSTCLLAAATAVITLALHAGYGFFRVGAPQLIENVGGDAEDYLQIAYTLAKVGRYERPGSVDVKRLLQSGSTSLPDPVGEGPDAWRPPVWTWVLSRMLLCTGYDLRAVFALRFLVDALTAAAFVFLLAPRFGPRVSVLGALLMALHPAWLIYSVTLLSEPLILTAHLLFLLALLRFVEGGRFFWLPAAAVLGGVAALTHNYFAAFPPLLAIGLWLARRLSLRQALGFLALFAATLAPWLVRNALAYHTAMPVLSTGLGVSMAKGWSSDFLAVYRNDTDSSLDENVGADLARLERLNPAQKSAYYTGLALRYVRSEWRMVPAILARKLVGAVTPLPERYRPGLLEAGRALFQVLTFLPLLWVVFAGGDRPMVVAVRALVLAYLVTSLLCFPTLRYRFPLIWAEVLSLCLFLEARAESPVGE
jgi:4-amino-4-deoxy-L-arabinose transferase-like glycosyltransferase